MKQWQALVQRQKHQKHLPIVMQIPNFDPCKRDINEWYTRTTQTKQHSIRWICNWIKRYRNIYIDRVYLLIYTYHIWIANINLNVGQRCTNRCIFSKWYKVIFLVEHRRRIIYIMNCYGGLCNGYCWIIIAWLTIDQFTGLENWIPTHFIFVAYNFIGNHLKSKSFLIEIHTRTVKTMIPVASGNASLSSGRAVCSSPVFASNKK